MLELHEVEVGHGAGVHVSEGVLQAGEAGEHGVSRGNIGLIARGIDLKTN